MLALAGSIASSQAVLIAYEGFDTANAIGSDASAAGVTGSGFSAYVNTNFRYDLEAGLGYSDSSGNTLVSVGRSAGIDVVAGGTQNLQLTLSSTISNTGTVFMSFVTHQTAGTSWGYAAGLTDAAVTDSASPTSALEAAFRSTSSNYGIYGDSTGIDARTGPDSTPPAYNPFFVVAELKMDTGVETMTIYLNPTDLANVSGTAAVTMTDTLSSGTWDDMTTFLFSNAGDELGLID